MFLFVASFLISSAFAQVAAKIGSREITKAEFEQKYAALKEQMVEVPSKDVVLEDMVTFEVGIQEALKRKLDQDPLIKERMMQELYKGFVEKEVGAKLNSLSATDAELKAYSDKNPEIRASHILIEVRQDATPEQKKDAQKRATEIYETIKKSGRRFEDLAKIYSDDDVSKKIGGDIGWQTRLSHHPVLYRASIALKVGDVSAPLETPFGFFIIKLTGKRSFADADRSLLRLAVLEEKKKAIYDKFVSGLRSQYKIQVNKKSL